MLKAFEAKKLILVLGISVLVIDASKKAPEVILDWVPCIHYSIQFRNNKKIIRALINSGSKINAMTFAYAKKLGLRT